tara:strand:- start:48 stop:821 length:774 start_codon:yes stop_codon:yes gene_type:complete
MKTPKIYQTKDYSLFNRIVGNRDIREPNNERHILNLMESYKEVYLPEPITVDKYFSVKNGHHRLEALTRLQFPVFYTIVNTEITVPQIQMINSINKKWDTTDYLTSNMDLEKQKYPNSYQYKPYHMYELFKKKYKFSHRNNLQLLCNFTAAHDRDIEAGFKFGKFKVSDWEKARSEADFILQQKKFIKQYKTRPFVSAFINVMRSYKFSRRQWTKKIEMNSQKLVHCTNTKDYLEVIQKVYNWGSQAKVAFELKDAA